MLDRITLGEVPRKHHIAFKNPKGELYYEECITTEGFEGPYTIAYHVNRPHTHTVSKPEMFWDIPKAAPKKELAKRHFVTPSLKNGGGAPLAARKPLFFNSDVTISVLFPNKEDTVYFSNGDSDELFYIFQGNGTLRSMLGDVPFTEGDYVYIPRGLLHRFLPDTNSKQHWLAIECHHGMNLLKQWRNEVGQLRMDAPYSHRDFKRPIFKGPTDEKIRSIVVKKRNEFHGFTLDHSPLDLVGWDGTVYPWAFPILNFQARAGLVHLPPTWHGTFGTKGALICSFVPRTLDFHPEAIPCPYPHSSLDCDEILFYCRGNFTSRKGVGPGSISLHPAGIPHGPHPGSYEKSIGVKSTDELAVMMDTFEPLQMTSLALEIEDPNYQESFK